MTAASAGPFAAPRRRVLPMAERYLLWLSFVLLGYALDGRGFAYLGFPPLFVGEMTLVAGLVILACATGWAKLWESPPILALFGFVGWGVARTIPFISIYGIDAVRDAAIYYYSAFAFIVGGLLIAQPRRLVMLLVLYRQFAKIFLVGIPIVAGLYRFGHPWLPRWPWGDMPMIQEKEGDVLVHLGGIIAFWMSGLAGPVPTPWSILLAINAASMGVIDRAGLVAFSASMTLGMAHNHRNPMGWRMLGIITAAIAVLWVSNLHVPIPGGKGRELSFDQVVINAKSTVSDSGTDGLDSTKEWRKDWWNDIIRDTVHGKFFWTGKGFGINLADEYGYQVLADHSLRSPHSAHMSVLGRMGVPGLVLWVLVQGIWAGMIGNAYWSSRRTGDTRWNALFLFLGAIWTAFLINSSFDVFLEGPMGGIWFWSVYGTGIGALWIYRHRPEVMYQG